MTTPSGDLVLHGMNFRSYDTEKKTWVLRWLNATGSVWLELGPPEFGGVRANDRTITLNLIDTFAPDVLSRATFLNISESHFTWRGEGLPIKDGLGRSSW